MEFKEPLSEEKQIELFYEFRKTKDKKIRKTLILHNLKLVQWVAQQFNRPGGRDLDDLFQQGVIGLMRAIEDYDPDKGAFSSYATLWIRNSIIRDIENNSRTIRIPVHMISQINNMKAVKRKLEKKLEREPTPKELSIEMDLDIEKIDEMIALTLYPLSIHTPVSSEEEDLTLEDSIKDNGPTPDLVAEDEIFMEKFKEEIKIRLTDLQYNSIVLNYGLNCRQHTLKEIGDMYGERAERVRTQRNKALNIVKEMEYLKDIKEEVEARTSYYKSMDYSRPWSKGGMSSSPVENIVLNREKHEEKLKLEMLLKLAEEKRKELKARTLK